MTAVYLSSHPTSELPDRDNTLAPSVSSSADDPILSLVNPDYQLPEKTEAPLRPVFAPTGDLASPTTSTARSQRSVRSGNVWISRLRLWGSAVALTALLWLTLRWLLARRPVLGTGLLGCVISFCVYVWNDIREAHWRRSDGRRVLSDHGFWTLLITSAFACLFFAKDSVWPLGQRSPRLALLALAAIAAAMRWKLHRSRREHLSVSRSALHFLRRAIAEAGGAGEDTAPEKVHALNAVVQELGRLRSRTTLRLWPVAGAPVAAKSFSRSSSQESGMATSMGPSKLADIASPRSRIPSAISSTTSTSEDNSAFGKCLRAERRAIDLCAECVNEELDAVVSSAEIALLIYYSTFSRIV